MPTEWMSVSISHSHKIESSKYGLRYHPSSERKRKHFLSFHIRLLLLLRHQLNAHSRSSVLLFRISKFASKSNVTAAAVAMATANFKIRNEERQNECEWMNECGGGVVEAFVGGWITYAFVFFHSSQRHRRGWENFAISFRFVRFIRSFRRQMQTYDFYSNENNKIFVIFKLLFGLPLRLSHIRSVCVCRVPSACLVCRRQQ